MMAAPTLTPTGIRTDLVARLIAAETSAGARVYDSPRWNFEPAILPAVGVSTIGGTEDRWASNQRFIDRTDRLAIECVVTGADEAATAAALDTLESEVCDATMGDPEWSQAFQRVQPAEWQRKIDASTADVIGRSLIVIPVEYKMDPPPPRTVPLREIDVTLTDADGVGPQYQERIALPTDEGEGG